jgi:hypothetical protein
MPSLKTEREVGCSYTERSHLQPIPVGDRTPPFQATEKGDRTPQFQTTEKGDRTDKAVRAIALLHHPQE